MSANIKEKHCLVLVLGGCLLTLSITAYAIDKDKHPVVTEKAINSFNQCLKHIDKKQYELSMVISLQSEYCKG